MRRDIMVKKIRATVLWTTLYFIILALFNFATGVNQWVFATIQWVIPSAIAYYIGYGHGSEYF